METLDRALTQEQAAAIIASVLAARRFAELVVADIHVHVEITHKGWIALTPMGEMIVATRDYLIRLAQIIERNEQASATVHSLLH